MRRSSCLGLAIALAAACEPGPAVTAGAPRGVDPAKDAGREGDGDDSESSDDEDDRPAQGDGDEGPRGGGKCDQGLEIVVRDFTEKHPDFESYGGELKGIVAKQLGADRKPIYAPNGATEVTTGKEHFDQWYRDVEGVNMRVPTTIAFEEVSDGVFVYDNSAFFPADGKGFGNGPVKTLLGIPIGGTPEHNFLFTTEAHTKFTYQGGEEFTFRGDDDLWVFINDRLAVDLGGVHGALAQTIKLDALKDELEIEVGETYPMDIFHAERHTDESNYRIETTIDLSCIENVIVL